MVDLFKTILLRNTYMLKMKTNLLIIILSLIIGLNMFAQAPLQYQLNQQGGGNCAGSPVELSVTTSISQNGHSLQVVQEVITADSFYE